MIETQYYFQDFTLDNYRKIFSIAKEKYRFIGYDEINDKEKQVLLRHDVDFSLIGAETLAQIENALGIKSTYFIFAHSEGYNLYETSMSKIVKRIINLGHDIGLHVDFGFYKEMYEGKNAEEVAIKEIEEIECVFGCNVKAVSFHNPELLGVLNLKTDWFANVVNAYSEKIFSTYKYCSDSNGYWRFDRLEDVLLSGIYDNLQILLHPVWWSKSVLSPAKRIYDYHINDAERRYKNYCDLVRKGNRINIGEEKI